MRQLVSLFLTASFLFLSQGVQASSIDDDNSSVLQGSGVVQVVSAVTAVTSSAADDLQCYRVTLGKKQPLFDGMGKLLGRRAQERGSDDTMSFVAEDGKLLWTNVLSGLAHHVRVEVMEHLQADPRGQLSLMTVSQGFRRLALVMPQRSNDAVSTGNSLKKRLFTVLIGGQTGDLDLFMKDGQLKALQTLSLPDLQDAFASRYYTETLSPTREHGKTYRSIGPGDIKRGIWGEPELSLVRKNLRLVPLNFPEASRIQRLYLGENKLIVAPVLTGLTGLRWLYLSNNQITAAPVVTGLPNLWKLDLSNNQITAAPVVTGLPKLKVLDLSNNKLTAAPVVTGLTGLEWLSLSNNQLSAAPVVTGLTELTGLQWLDLSNNQITAAPVVTGLPNLMGLYLNNNQITAAPVVTGLNNLMRIILSNNKLSAAPVVTGLTGLQWLVLSNNQITAAPVVTGLTNLWKLDLSNNQITAAPVVTGLPKLKVLNFSNNQLTAAPDVSGLEKLETLHLDSNLCDDPTLLKTLRDLNRGRNDTSKIRFYSFSKDAQGNTVETRVSLN